MRRLFPAIATLMAIHVVPCLGALVPWPIVTDPTSIQRLTASIVQSQYSVRGIGDCGAMAAADFRTSPAERLVVVADPAWNRLAYFMVSDSDGSRTLDTARCYPTSGFESELDIPSAVATNPAVVCGHGTKRDVYVANHGSKQILRFEYDEATRRLSYCGVLYEAADTFRPAGLTCFEVSEAVTFVVATDDRGCRVRLLSVNNSLGTATLLTSYGTRGRGTGQFMNPVGVAVVPTTTANAYAIYVADAGNSRVVLLNYSNATQQVTWISATRDSTCYPTGLAVNPSGYVYVASPSRNCVTALTPDLDSVLYCIHAPAGADSFVAPGVMCIVGDEIGVGEAWTDSSGIQFFRIVPGLKNVTSTEALDVTSDDSLVVGLELEEAEGYVDAHLSCFGLPTIHIVDDTLLPPGIRHTIVWHGLDDDGKLALPGDYDLAVTARYRLDCTNPPLMSRVERPFRVKGTRVPASIGASDTWDMLHEPYVLAEHDFRIDGGATGSATLTIQPGVRVMFHDLSQVGGGIVNIDVIYVNSGCRIEALGTAQDSVYFLPHHKMETYAVNSSMWWGGLHFRSGSYGGRFRHCVFENGGCDTTQAVLYARKPADEYRIVVDGCHFRWALSQAITERDNARDQIDIANCQFEGGGSFPIYTVKAPAAGRVSATCTFLHNGLDNKYNGMLVDAVGDIAAPDTWRFCDPSGAGFFYQISDGGDLTIESELHIDAGVRLRLGSTNCLITDEGGAIIAEGTSGAPVVFEGTGGGATWPGIELRSGSGVSSFTDCVFRDGVGDKANDIPGDVDYYPMLSCIHASPILRGCTFENAQVGAPHDDSSGTGVYINESYPSIKQCVFRSNEVGIVAKLAASQSCLIDSCVIKGGAVGFVVVSKQGSSLAGIRYSNIYAHFDTGVVNFDDSETLYARHNWWGWDGIGQPGYGNNDTAYGLVWCDSADTGLIPILGHDAQVCSIVRPRFDVEPGVVEPMGVAQNNCCDEETLIVTMRMRKGAVPVYDDTVRRPFAPFSSDSVKFDSVELDTGTYVVVFKVALKDTDEVPENDSLVRSVHVAMPPRWREMAALPDWPSGKTIKDGGCLAYDAGTNRIYASKGKKSGEFYTYDVPADTWANLTGIPLGADGKQAGKGSVICSDGNGKLYLTKGNNTVGFWEYDAATDAWTQKADVPLGLAGKKVKPGAGLAWAKKNGVGAAYLLKGGKNEFYKYDPVTDNWTQLPDAPPPAGTRGHSKWGPGSWLVADPRPGAHRLYAFKGSYHEFYTYDTDAGTWSQAKNAIPVSGGTSNKKAKDGSCAAWYSGRIYALKGNNTTEFWCYFPTGDSWQVLEDIPLVGISGRRKAVKTGGALAGYPGTGVYAFKGNNTLEFWRYNPGQEEEEGSGEATVQCASGALGTIPRPGQSPAAGPTLDGEEPVADGLEAAKPRWNWQGTWVCYSKTDTLTGREQVYQCQYGLFLPEQRVTEIEADCEEPVYSPSGEYIAFQLDETVSGYYQLCVTPGSDTGFGESGGADEVLREPVGCSDATGTTAAVAPVKAVAAGGLGIRSALSDKSVMSPPRIADGVTALGLVWQTTFAAEDHCYPEWSLDGEWLCYERDDDSGYTQVWRVPAFGGTEEQLTFGNSDHYLPSYLNSSEIVFTLSPNDGYDQIAKVNVLTHQVTVLSGLDTDHDRPSPAWNGSDVVAEALDDAGNTNIVKMSVLGGETWLTSGTSDIMEPDYSQDNQRVFAVRWTGITSQIVYVDAENGGYYPVTDSLAIRDNPDAYFDPNAQFAMAVYEREAWDPENLLFGHGRRRHGSGVYVAKFRKPKDEDGPQGASLGVLALDRAVPSPATDRVKIRWQVPVEADVSLRIYNTAGQLVKVLADGKTKPGAYTSVWNGTDAKGRRLANGVYFYTLDNGAKRISRKVVLTE